MEEVFERWRPVVNYEGLYEVSNLGQVRSLARMTRGRWGGMKLSTGKLLKPHVMKLGYLRVDLSKNGKATHFNIHRLVALAFLKPVKGKHCVNHKDNNPANNVVTNLEWCTHKENTQHAVAQNRMAHGPRKNVFCKYGHRDTPANVYVGSGGTRSCRECQKRSNRVYMRKVRAQQRLRLKSPHGEKGSDE